MNFCEVSLMGHVVGRPKMRELGNGAKVANFSVAVNTKYRDSTGHDREDCCYLDCAAFGDGRATWAVSNLDKGDRVFARGVLKQDTWEDKQTGKNRSKHSLLVQMITKTTGERTAKEKPIDLSKVAY